MVHSFTELHKAVIHVIILFRILGFPCCGPGSIPGPENEILQAVWHGSSIPGPPPKKGYDFVNTIFGIIFCKELSLKSETSKYLP